VEEKPETPFLADDFESYGGVSEMLNRSWTVNKASECHREFFRH